MRPAARPATLPWRRQRSGWPTGEKLKVQGRIDTGGCSVLFALQPHAAVAVDIECGRRVSTANAFVCLHCKGKLYLHSLPIVCCFRLMLLLMLRHMFCRYWAAAEKLTGGDAAAVAAGGLEGLRAAFADVLNIMQQASTASTCGWSA